MSLVATTTAGAAESCKKAQAENNFAAIPTGNYEVTVAKGEVIEFAKQGKYVGMKALNVQLRVIESSAVGAKRVFFLKVPLFDKFLPTAKNPDGAPNFTYFSFFGSVGATDDQLESGQLPSLKDILGKPLVAKINYFPIGSKDQEFHTNKDTGEDEAWNEVSSVWLSTGASAEGAREVKGDPWASSTPAAAPAAPAAAAPAIDPWAPQAPAPVAAAAPEPAPVAAASAAPAAEVPTDPWTPAAEDVDFANVVAAGAGKTFE